MELDLRGKVVLVTGGSKGIGRSISVAFAAEGARVAIAARGAAALRETRQAIEDAGGEAIDLAADLTKEDEVRDSLAEIEKRWGRLDILVNNAGGTRKFGAFPDLGVDDWMDCFRMNVLSCVNVTKAAEKLLLQAEAASIVTISSVTAVQPGMMNPHYNAMKAATLNLTKSLANYYSPRKIRVNAVCPGPVHSDSWNENASQLAAQRQMTFDEAYALLEKQEQAKVPLGRIGEGEDVAAVVLFLASSRAEWITGSCFHISGGKYSAIS